MWLFPLTVVSYENELPLDTPYHSELDDPANSAYTDLKEEIENFVSIIMSQCMRFPTMWHFGMCRLGRASAASF